jgi:hypothetical protein
MSKKNIVVICALLIVFFININDAIAETRLTWDPSSGVVRGYNIYAQDIDTGIYDEFQSVETEFPFSSMGLVEGVRYKFWIRGFNEAGESTSSNTVEWGPVCTVPAIANPFTSATINVKVNQVFNINGSGTGWAQTEKWEITVGATTGTITYTSGSSTAIAMFRTIGTKRVKFTRMNPLNPLGSSVYLNVVVKP